MVNRTNSTCINRVNVSSRNDLVDEGWCGNVVVVEPECARAYEAKDIAGNVNEALLYRFLHQIGTLAPI